MKKLKIISGGQTGVDQIALEVAYSLGIETGGTAPKGFKTETGKNYELRDKYGLVQHNSDEYPPRTEMNVLNASLTLIFGNMELSKGTALTKKLCIKHGRQYLFNPTVEEIQEYLIKGYLTINVAGPRESTSIEPWRSHVRKILTEAFS